MAPLTDPELERYARQIVLPQFGGVGQRKLKAARVAVIGAGGIGSSVIPALAGGGVGHLTIIDDDVVDLTNLHRQPLFSEADVGYPKVERASRFVERMNGHVQVAAQQLWIDQTYAEKLLPNHDLVVDGSDNFETRLVVSDACVKLGIPLLSAAAAQFQGQIALYRSQPCYRCFVGDAFDADDCDTCAEQGVLGALTATVGSFAALLAINSIAGVGADQAGKLHLFDGMALSWRTIRIPADPNCSTCAQSSA